MFSLSKKTKTQLAIAAVVICLLVVATTIFSLAANPTPEGIIKELLKVIFDIAKWIGILLLAWGAITLVLAIRNEDADSKSRAVLFLVVAIVLICLGSVFSDVLTAIGVSI